jgi:hypothetical protein
MTRIIPNDITVTEQFERIARLTNSVKDWARETNIKDINLVRLEQECGIRCKLQTTSFGSAYLIQWECVDESKFAWFILRWG